jgi:2-phospho-L-lactate guanylyltransferase
MAQVVIAVRGGRTAKSRCAGTLNGADRARLTAVMLEDMLAALARCEDVSQTWVVTPTPELTGLAHESGARTIRQPRAAGLNAAFRLAMAEVAEVAPYEPLVLMPGDLPRLAPEDLSAALQLVRTHAVTLAPSMDGGTGLVALRAGSAWSPAFGAHSFRRHAAAAERRGLSVAVIGADSLSRDVDRPDDLIDVMRRGATTRTAAFLRERLKPRIRS